MPTTTAHDAVDLHLDRILARYDHLMATTGHLPEGVRGDRQFELFFNEMGPAQLELTGAQFLTLIERLVIAVYNRG